MPEQVQFYDQYDMDSTSYKYGKVQGPYPGWGGVSTSGSSDTVTAASSYAFAGLKAGDLMWFRTADETTTKRIVKSVTSDTVIVLTAVVALAAGTPWHYLPFTIGTAITDGWHRIAHWREVTVHILATTIAAAGGVDVTIEVRGGGNFTANPNTVYTKNYPTSGEEDAVIVTEKASEMRVGVKGGSGFAGADSITIFAIGRKENR